MEGAVLHGPVEHCYHGGCGGCCEEAGDEISPEALEETVLLCSGSKASHMMSCDVMCCKAC